MMKTLIIFVFLSLNSFGGVVLDIPSALDLHFPNHEVKKKTIFLTDKSKDALELASKSKFKKKIYTIYEAKLKGKPNKFAIMETHILRSRTQTIFVVFNNKGMILSTEVLAFYEPDEYVMSKKWFNQFKGKGKKEKLLPGYDIIKVSGATISYNETSAAIRRMIALYNYVYN